MLARPLSITFVIPCSLDTATGCQTARVTTRLSHTAGARLLAERVPQMAALVAAAGPIRIRPPQDSHFAALVRAITYQQLAGPAAATIHGRLVVALDGVVEPARLLTLTDEALRGAGLSANKTASLRDLAAKVLDGTVVLDQRRLTRLSDEEVSARLTTVRGIGQWTADMFLIFQLRRLDIWPTGDLGVRKGYGLAWGIPTPSAKQLDPFGDELRPFRSVAAWYCWRAVELYVGAVASAVTR
jgi:DNA-3-methyladenine glycosylase II